MKTEQNVKLTFLQGRIRICIQDNLTPSLPSCVVVRGGWQCVRHPDGARRRRRGGLALDGGLVLSAVLVHSCNLRGRGQRDANPQTRPNHLFLSRVSHSNNLFLHWRGCAYLSPVFPQVAGLLRQRKDKTSVSVMNESQLAQSHKYHTPLDNHERSPR